MAAAGEATNIDAQLALRVQRDVAGASKLNWKVWHANLKRIAKVVLRREADLNFQKVAVGWLRALSSRCQMPSHLSDDVCVM